MKASSVLTISLLVLSHAVTVFSQAMRPVQRGQHPYLVLIKLDTSEGSRYFTGTLLSRNWALTLSENLYDMTITEVRSRVTVIAGITRLIDMRKAQQRTVSEFIKTVEEGNEKYPTMLLLKVDRPFAVTQDVKPVQVNNGYVQRKCVAAGWSKSVTPGSTVPQMVQVAVDVVSTAECGDQFNAISYESQICTVQKYEYSFFPGSALLCSNALSAIKSVDTYMTPASSRDRVILYVRAKPYTTWMRAHVLDMAQMVVLPRGLRDNLMETWEKQPGFKRSGLLNPPNEESSAVSVIGHNVILALCCVLVVVCKLIILQL